MTVTTIDVATAAELMAVLRDNATAPARRRVRYRGRGTRPRLLTPPPEGTLLVSLAGLARIERLEPDDLTCSVQPGVPCRELATVLADKGLELGGLRAEDPGTVGGLYAADPLGSPSPGAAGPRSTLLGLDAVLADGGSFRSGARVVKSVAGFDVHKLFVGSQGRLFAATLLHLKVRPAARARATFVTGSMQLAPALEKFQDLRRLPTPPPRLLLRRTAHDIAIHGSLVGRASQVQRLLRTSALHETDLAIADHLPEPAAGSEIVVGCARPSRLAALLMAVPESAPFVVHGSGHFELELTPSATDALLSRLPDLEAHAAIAVGSLARLRRRSAEDPGAAELQGRLVAALDPLGVLA